MKKSSNIQTLYTSAMQTSANSNGLSNLQKCTTEFIESPSQWGFAGSPLQVTRHKLDDNTWQLTVINPKTLKTILQAEGNGDTVFEHEDSLARMAETLIAQGLKIRTQFNE